MFRCRTRPKDPLHLINLLVGDAVVVSHTTTRRLAQFFQDVGGISEWEERCFPEAMSQIYDDRGIATGISWRVHGFLPMDDATFGTASDAILFFLQTAGENYICVVRSLRQEEVNDTEELQSRQRLARKVSVRQRDQRVKA